MLKNAPAFDEVKIEIQNLSGHHLIAHNSDFEKKFFPKKLFLDLQLTLLD